MQIVNALFNQRSEAERAFDALVANGFNKNNISMITQSNIKEVSRHLSQHDKTRGMTKGAATGLVLGILGGVAALMIPSFAGITILGMVAAIGGGAIIGTLFGSLVGNMGETMKKAGVDENDAQALSDAVEHGNTLLSAEINDNDANNARAILAEFEQTDKNGQTTSIRNQTQNEQVYARVVKEDTPYTRDELKNIRAEKDNKCSMANDLSSY